jgi:N utilization substance protein B
MEPNFRHIARVAAAGALYAIDVGKSEVDQAVSASCDELELPRRWRRLAAKSVASVLEKQAEIDEIIRRHAIGFSLERMAAVDRALLRLGIYELLFGGLPKAVAIDEAVQIAKEYSTEDSGKFVNGILGKVAAE